MAKKQQQQTDPKAQTLARIRRTEAYAEKVRLMFAATVNQILTLNKTMPTLAEGEMFSFDSLGIKKQQEVERLLRQLHSVATMAIQQGIKLEWAQANAECDKLVQSVFGKKALETPQFTAFTQRNEAAMAAFIARSEKGLNLSQRVWRSCRQLRDEMEVAITVGIGDGTSAATLSRSVRQYLNDPDLMFRRFQYNVKEPVRDADGNIVLDKNGKPKMQNKLDKNGNPIVKKKWKKRIADPDNPGKYKFIDYDKDSYHDEWTGPGYYKSSAQNAMRVTRTETNIAYRRADNERWQQMDFVLGQRVQLSRSHPKEDICDKLAGDYPPDFVFDGWHPQCFCFVTPILVDEDEIVKMNEAMMRGETYTPRGKRITQYPDNFKQWVNDNKERLLAAHDNGNDPYFVRNNFAAVQNILNPKKQLTPLEIAEQRHAARTPEQEEAIRLKWQERQQQREAERQATEADRIRQERIKTTANNVLGVANGRFKDFDIDTTALSAAMQSGDTAIINAETRALAKIMSEKQKQIKSAAHNVIFTASKFKDLDGTAALTSLEDAVNTGNLSAINAQTVALQQRVTDIKAKLKTMSMLFDADKWAEDYTVAELQTANAAAEKTYKDKMGKFYLRDIKTMSVSDLQDFANILKYEAEWKQSHPKYNTDPVVEDSYRRRYDEVMEELQWRDIKTFYNDFVMKHASLFPTLAQELADAIAAKDFSTATAAMNRLKQWETVITQRATIAAAIGASHTALLTDLDNAIKSKQQAEAQKAVGVLQRWQIVIAELQKAQTAKQTKELKELINELQGHIASKKIDEAEGLISKIKKLTMSPLEIYCEKHYTEKFTVNSQKSYDKVMTQMGKASQPVWSAATLEQKRAFVDYCGSYSHSMLCDIAAGRQNTRVDNIDAVMSQIKYPHDIVLRSGQNYEMAEHIFNADFRTLLESHQIDELNKKYAGIIGTNVAYMSTSFNQNGGFAKQFEFHLFCPKGTSMMNVYVLSPYGGDEGVNWDGASYPPRWSKGGETEIFLGRGLLYKFIRAEAGTGMNGRTRIYVQVIGTV